MQVVGDAHMVDGAFDISPLDPRQQIRHGSIKQEEHADLQSVHSCGDAEYQVQIDQFYMFTSECSC